MTHASFSSCWPLTDAAVLALAEKCPESTHGTFGGDFNCKLTGADVLALADKRLGISHASFRECKNLTDAARAALCVCVCVSQSTPPLNRAQLVHYIFVNQ